MTGVIVRPATPSDAASIAAIHVHSFLATYAHLPATRRSAEGGLEGRVAFWYRHLRRPGTGHSTLVAIESGQICGFVHLGPSPEPDDGRETGHVFSIHVSPGRTGGGVGTRLMRGAEVALRAADHRTATLWVVGENHRARRFYERLGWRDDGARRHESLAVGSEEGDLVDVIRYRLDLIADTEFGA